jgi:hypothetical protein
VTANFLREQTEQFGLKARNGEPESWKLHTSNCKRPLRSGANHVEANQFIAYPAAFHASTPPFSTVTFVKPCSWYFAA